MVFKTNREKISSISLLLILFIHLSECKKKVETKELIFKALIEFSTETQNAIIGSDINNVQYKNKLNTIFAYSELGNEILAFDYETQKNIWSLPIDSYGIKDCRYFYFFNSDTLLIAEESTSNYYIISKKKGILHKHNFGKKKNNLGGASGLNLYEINHSILVNNAKPSPFKNDLKYYEEVIFNPFKNNKNERKYNLFTKEYLDKGWKNDKSVRRCVKDNLIYYSRYNDHSLLVFDKDKFIKKIHLPKSKYLKNDIYFKDSLGVNNPKKVVEKILLNEGYLGLFYDEYNNVFYRIVELASSYKIKNNDIYFNWQNTKPFSIMIFDTDFNLLGEQIFPAYIYRYMNLLITKDGVLFSKDNDFNKDNIGWKLQYDIFKLVDND